jgi:methylthioribulose-1-phosphate dehydratase
MNQLTATPSEFCEAEAADPVERLRAIGHEFHARGWSLGTSSNYSVVVNHDPLELLITASGKDKSALVRDDILRVNATGDLLDPVAAAGRKSSAETLLHCLIADLVPDVGAILHTHSVWGTILSRAALRPAEQLGSLRIEGYEMLKGLEGITTHEAVSDVPVFANSQDMVELSARIRDVLCNQSPQPSLHGFLLAGHGLYTWGKTLAAARRHIEIFEFLFEVTARQRMLPPA